MQVQKYVKTQTQLCKAACILVFVMLTQFTQLFFPLLWIPPIKLTILCNNYNSSCAFKYLPVTEWYYFVSNEILKCYLGIHSYCLRYHMDGTPPSINLVTLKTLNEFCHQVWVANQVLDKTTFLGSPGNGGCYSCFKSTTKKQMYVSADHCVSDCTKQ